jgi:hypothetical protein
MRRRDSSTMDLTTAVTRSAVSGGCVHGDAADTFLVQVRQRLHHGQDAFGVAVIRFAA